MKADILNVAVYVDDFLPYTNPWIYRQITYDKSSVRLVITNKRSNAEHYKFENCVVGTDESKWWIKIKYRLWKIFKYVKPSLNSQSYSTYEKALSENSISLVHAHFGTNGVLIAPLCKKKNIPLVVTFHGFDISSAPLRWPAYHKQLLKLFDQIKYAIAISDEMAQRLVQIGCPADKIKVLYLGVPIDEFPFQDRFSRQTPVRFIHAGRLTAKKGVPDLVKSFAETFKIPGEAELLIAGDGEEKVLVNETIEKTKPACTVKMLGRLSDDELLKLRTEADVFVINCRTDNSGTKEGLPISILEASCTGLPVISTYHAGIPEAIKDKETGILIDEYDNTALKNAMLTLMDKTVRIQMGKAAHQYMLSKFSLEKCNQELENLYTASIK